MKRHKSVGDALEWVASHPLQSQPDTIDVPVYELVCRTLFDLANRPDPKERGSMARATKAQKIILDRMVGKRRPGTHPATLTDEAIDFADLTQGALDG